MQALGARRLTHDCVACEEGLGNAQDGTLVSLMVRALDGGGLAEGWGC